MNNDQRVRALKLIRRSSLVDFELPILWAQWCRDVACAALDEDDAMLDNLEKELPKPQKAEK
jgi:hypothetical protein